MQAVKPFGGSSLEEAVGVAVDTLGQHHVKSLSPESDHFRNELWWILQVRVDGDDGRPLRMVQATSERSLFSKAARQVDDGEVGEVVSFAAQTPECVVCAAVVDANDLKAQLRGLQDGKHSGEEGLYATFFIEHGANEG